MSSGLHDDVPLIYRDINHAKSVICTIAPAMYDIGENRCM